MIRRPPRSTLDRSSAASDVYKRQLHDRIWTEWQRMGAGLDARGRVRDAPTSHTLPHLTAPAFSDGRRVAIIFLHGTDLEGRPRPRLPHLPHFLHRLFFRGLGS